MQVAKDARECVQECISEFISFITSEASDRCHQVRHYIRQVSSGHKLHLTGVIRSCITSDSSRISLILFEVCCVGGQRRKGSEWWSEEVGVAITEKRRAFEEWLQRRNRDTYGRYRAQRAVVKQAIKVAKRMADWR